MTWEVLFSMLVGVASSTALTQGVMAVFQRRKVSADATEVLSQTAISQLQSMRSDLESAKADMQKMRDEQRDFRKVLHEHERWDRMVIVKLGALGVDVPTAPELWL